MGKSSLRKSCFPHFQFDGSVIKTFGSLDLEDKLEVIPTIVATCKKNYSLLRNDVLNVNSTKLINNINMEKKSGS